jgi:hypothetical protein
MHIRIHQGENLGSLIARNEDFILIIGMYGCEPCDIFENRLDHLSKNIKISEPIKYVKLRPSQFHVLRERSILHSVPVIISYRNGCEHKRVEGLPGAIPLDEYTDQFFALISAAT